MYARTLLAFYARTARAHGIQDGQTGTVTVIQRFSSGLQLNVHFHTLLLDGVFSEARPGQLTVQVVRYGRPAPDGTARTRGQPPRRPPPHAWTWAALMRRVRAAPRLLLR